MADIETLLARTRYFTEVAAPSTPAAGTAVMFLDTSDGLLKWKDDAGTVYPLDGSGGGSHASSHQSGGGDAIKLDDLAAPDDNTDLNATTSAHGLLKKLDNNAAHFLDGQGNWSTPSGGSAEACHAYNNGTSSSLSSGDYRYLDLDSETRDDGSFHSTVSNTSRLTAPSTGWYVITGGTWENSNVGSWSLYLRKNRTTTLTPEAFMGTANRGLSQATIAYLTAGDYVELAVYFASSTRTFGNNASPDTMTYLAMARVA